jgi:hypothetical protein
MRRDCPHQKQLFAPRPRTSGPRLTGFTIHAPGAVALGAGGAFGRRMGTIRDAELHWHEATGIGRKELKIKQYLDCRVSIGSPLAAERQVVNRLGRPQMRSPV